MGVQITSASAGSSAIGNMATNSTPELGLQVPALQEQNRQLRQELSQAARREASLVQHLAHSRSTASDLAAQLDNAQKSQRSSRRAAKEALAGLAAENAQLAAGYADKQAALKRLQASCEGSQAAWQQRLQAMDQQLAANQQHIAQLTVLVEQLTHRTMPSDSNACSTSTASANTGVNRVAASQTTSSSSSGKSASGNPQRSSSTRSVPDGRVLGDATNTKSASAHTRNELKQQQQQQQQRPQSPVQWGEAKEQPAAPAGDAPSSTQSHHAKGSQQGTPECSGATSSGSGSSCPVTPDTCHRPAASKSGHAAQRTGAAGTAAAAAVQVDEPSLLMGAGTQSTAVRSDAAPSGRVHTDRDGCNDHSQQQPAGQGATAVNDVQQKHAAKLQQAQRLKRAGNASYSSGAYKAAYRAWTQALQLQVEDAAFNAVLYCNRAAALHSLGYYLDAVADCYIAAHLDPGYPRILQRRAEALTAIGDHTAAAADLETLAASSPGNLDVCRRLRQVQACIRAGEGLNHYVVLGLRSSCVAADVKVAYKRLALKYHPDKAPNAAHRAASEALFRLISAANTVLSDPAQRRKYDVARQQRRLQRGAAACHGFSAVYAGAAVYSWRAATSSRP